MPAQHCRPSFRPRLGYGVAGEHQGPGRQPRLASQGSSDSAGTQLVPQHLARSEAGQRHGTGPPAPPVCQTASLPERENQSGSWILHALPTRYTLPALEAMEATLWRHWPRTALPTPCPRP